MGRVGLVVLSIGIATALLVGSSYGALWVQPLLLQIPDSWMIIAAAWLLPAGYFLSRRLQRRARA